MRFVVINTSYQSFSETRGRTRPLEALYRIRDNLVHVALQDVFRKVGLGLILKAHEENIRENSRAIAFPGYCASVPQASVRFGCVWSGQTMC